jgi:hypothetical protein
MLGAWGRRHQRAVPLSVNLDAKMSWQSKLSAPRLSGRARIVEGPTEPTCSCGAVRSDDLALGAALRSNEDGLVNIDAVRLQQFGPIILDAVDRPSDWPNPQSIRR